MSPGVDAGTVSPVRPGARLGPYEMQVVFWLGQRWAEMGMSIYQPLNWTTVGATGAFWLAARAALLRRQRLAS